MPKERGTYVITASVYVDDVYSPEEAAAICREVTLRWPMVQIRLSDEQQWEKVDSSS